MDSQPQVRCATWGYRLGPRRGLGGKVMRRSKVRVELTTINSLQSSIMVTVEIPSGLRHCCRGETQISVDAATVRAVLEQLERDFPELYRSVCNETGAIRRHMNLFLNTELLPEGTDLDLPLDDGDVVHIFTAVSGG